MSITFPFLLRMPIALLLANFMLTSCTTLKDKNTIEPAECGEPNIPSEEHPSTIERIDFQRGLLDEGLIMINLSSPCVLIESRLSTYGAVLVFENTKLVPSIQPTLRVGDFQTPVRRISVSGDGRSASVVVDTYTPDFELILSQSDGLLTLEFEHASVKEIEQTGE